MIATSIYARDRRNIINIFFYIWRLWKARASYALDNTEPTDKAWALFRGHYARTLLHRKHYIAECLASTMTVTTPSLLMADVPS